MSERGSLINQGKLSIGDECTLANFYLLHTEGITEEPVYLFPSSGCFESESGVFSVFSILYGCKHIHQHVNLHLSPLSVEMLMWCKQLHVKGLNEKTQYKTNREVRVEGLLLEQ